MGDPGLSILSYTNNDTALMTILARAGKERARGGSGDQRGIAILPHVSASAGIRSDLHKPGKQGNKCLLQPTQVTTYEWFLAS